MALYLVTGGAGFIGSHLSGALLQRDHRVRVVDSLVTGKRENLAHLPGVEFVKGDLAELEVAREAVSGVDYVLHQAAIPSVPRSVADPVTSHRANLDASLNVLVAARDAKVKRVVYAGSSSAYGDLETLPKREDMPTRPLSPYALQKLVVEHAAGFAAGITDGERHRRAVVVEVALAAGQAHFHRAIGATIQAMEAMQLDAAQLALGHAPQVCQGYPAPSDCFTIMQLREMRFGIFRMRAL